MTKVRIHGTDGWAEHGLRGMTDEQQSSLLLALDNTTLRLYKRLLLCAKLETLCDQTEDSIASFPSLHSCSSRDRRGPRSRWLFVRQLRPLAKHHRCDGEKDEP